MIIPTAITEAIEDLRQAAAKAAQQDARRSDYADEDVKFAVLVAAIEAALGAARVEGSNGIGLTMPVDLREPDPARAGFWALHNCAGCENGRWPCITKLGYRDCNGPRARND